MGEAEDRRREIDVGDRLERRFDAAAAVQISPRRVDHERQMERLLVREHLPLRDPVLAEELPVVRDEDEHGSPELGRVCLIAL